jgi:hypothetical protein
MYEAIAKRQVVVVDVEGGVKFAPPWDCRSTRKVSLLSAEHALGCPQRAVPQGDAGDGLGTRGLRRPWLPQRTVEVDRDVGRVWTLRLNG